MTLEKIRTSLIISAIAAMVSGGAFVFFMVSAPKTNSELNNPNALVTPEATPDELEAEVNVLTENAEQNFFQYKPIFERSLLALMDKKTVEFYETRINNPKIRYFYKTDYRNKRFYKYTDYNVEDFESIEELEKKVDVVKEVYIDGVFYIVDTKALITVKESEQKKFENSTIHMNDLRESASKYLELYELENGPVSIMELASSNPDDPKKTRYGFQSQILGDAALVMDEKFDIWEMSIEFKGVYSTFVFEAYNNDLNISALEEGVELNLLELTPSPSVSPEISPSPATSVIEITPPVSPTPSNVMGVTDTKIDSNVQFKLSDTCGKSKGSCYLEFMQDAKLNRIFITSCDTDCDSKRTILSLHDEKYQYVVEGYKTTNGFTKVFKFDKDTQKVTLLTTIDQNILEIFDPTKVKTSIDPKLASYTNGCFNPLTAGLYCIGNLNRMSEDDIEKIENYIKNAANVYKTYIEEYI